MPGTRPETYREWLVTKDMSEGIFAAIAVLDPKSNCEVAGLFVVQPTVMEVLATTLVRFEMTGGLISTVDEGAEGSAGGAVGPA